MTQTPTARPRKSVDRSQPASDPARRAVPRTVRPHRGEATRRESQARSELPGGPRWSAGSPARAATRSAENRRGRPRTGTVRRWTRRDGDEGFGLAFYDQEGIRRYEACGLASEGWSAARAEVVLENFVLAVADGTYRPATEQVDSGESDPLFEDFALEVLALHAEEVSSAHRAFQSNLLRNHLLPEFRGEPLSLVNTTERIEAFRSKQLRKMRQIRRSAERGQPLYGPGGRRMSLSERTINHAIGVLAFILQRAVHRTAIGVTINAARNLQLHVRVPKKVVRDWLEADELRSLLDAATLTDQPARAATLMKAAEVRRLRDEHGLTVKQTADAMGISEGGVCYLTSRRPVEGVSMMRTIIAVLGATGTRNTELCRLRPIDLDFVHGRIRISRAKTAAGQREIDMSPWLQAQLEEYVASLGTAYDPEGPLFPNGRGNAFNKDTLNKRIRRVHRIAAELRRRLEFPPLPTGISAHVFRRTYVSAMIEAGAPLSYVQKLVGHETRRRPSESTTASCRRPTVATSGARSISSWPMPFRRTS